MRSLLQRFARFAVVGVVATVTHAGVFAIAVELGKIEPVTANALAFVAAVLVGYALNRRWTFGAHEVTHTRLWRYVAAALAVLALNSMIMYFVAHVAHWSPYVGLVIAIALAPPVSFALNQYWVFRPHRPRA